jgi:putative transposase
MSEINRAYKYRIYPTKRQASVFCNHMEMCRYIYNWALAERIRAYKEEGKTLTFYGQCRWVQEVKRERPWFREVYAHAFNDVLKRLDLAYKAFFRRLKAGEKPGFPRFRKRGTWTSLCYTEYHRRPKDRREETASKFKRYVVTCPKVGDVVIRYTREIPEGADIRRMTVVREGGKWFVCIVFTFSASQAGVAGAKAPECPQAASVGIDLGLSDFVYDSDGNRVSFPGYLRRAMRDLKRAQRRLSGAKKRTKRYYKLLRVVRQKHYRVRCKRNDFLHKVANGYVSRYSVVYHEKLQVRNMVRRPKPVSAEADEKVEEFEASQAGVAGAESARRPAGAGGSGRAVNGRAHYLPNGASAKTGLNRGISDAGWHRFILYLTYKGEVGGCRVYGVSPKNTSQACSVCGELVKKSLSVRTHVCGCGAVLNRDYNAAKNILQRGVAEAA